MDAHSKWVEVFVMRTTTSEKTVKKLRGVFAAYGLPEEIVTDNGPQFTSQHFGTFLSRNGIHHSKSPPYHPVSNGSAERCVQTVKKDLFKQILYEERKGDKKSIQHRIDQFLFSYRNTPSSTTGETPAQIFLSWQPRTRLSLLHPEMEQRMCEKGEQAKLHADQKRGPWRDFWEGDQVLVKGLRPDDDKWLLGTIAQRCSACTYIVRVGDEDRYVHADNLRLRTFQENRRWLKAAGTVLDGPRVENKGPLFRDTREHTSASTPTRLNDQDQPASNLTSPADESAGPSTEPSPGFLHDSGPTLDSGPHNGDPSGQSTPHLRRFTRLRRPPDRYVP
ncbi:uncharacterized protein K02A2.6-like [Rhipicephalus sanguineus]|uniref:uncharacterized protein K02A2.6-like n=1 Tax=Rhipicephalus sanguineus TaxID=34632 RepID=UPI001892DA1C|nr:uncharacterized protein K02A2.6-like [Rhipicephalus sanguineus]